MGSNSACRSSLEDIAWAAGFFDGEGSFSVSSASRCAHVSIAQTQREPLDRFLAITAQGKVLGPYLRQTLAGTKKKDLFGFHAYGHTQARHIMRTLWPFLGRVKRDQALSALTKSAAATVVVEESAPIRLTEARFNARQRLAWAAGFFDGEGCFSYSKSSKHVCISITQRDIEVLERFKESVGLGRIYGPYRHRPGSTLSDKEFHVFRAYGYEQVQAIGAMLWFKLGSAKRAQAARVLKLWPRTCHRGHPLASGRSGCPRCTREYWLERHRKKAG